MGKGGAAVCIEISDGHSASFAVEINQEQYSALDEIMLCASEHKGVPSSLKKYVEQIIEMANGAAKEWIGRGERT